jgi:L-threonylcarbamoyladenylate synthase
VDNFLKGDDMAIMMTWNDDTCKFCVHELWQNCLVSFPTETVYGLGANALSDDAVLKVFHVKGRPKTDPLIVHVDTVGMAFLFTDMTPFQSRCFSLLMERFSPGPLTLIVKAGPQLSRHVTGGGDFVGIRIPNHPVALSLIKECALPIAAPSANTFGHVSPTSASHVMDDLGAHTDLTIIESPFPCQIGIESTVVKICEEKELIVLRPGAISLEEIRECFLEESVDFEISQRTSYVENHNKKNMESPGQLITHYAPRITTYLFSESQGSHDGAVTQESILKKTIFIDFNKQCLKHKNNFLKYFDLSLEGDLYEASSNLFSILRAAENVEGGEYILLNSDFCVRSRKPADHSLLKNDISKAIFDRMYRAASGRIINFSFDLR